MAWPAAAAPADRAEPFSPPLRLRVGDASAVIPSSVVSGATDTPADRVVTFRGDAGTRTADVGGTSIAAFLGALGLPLDAIGGVELQAGTGRTVRLTPEELRDGFSGDPGCPNCKATLDVDARRGTVHFVRPLRSASDANAGDELSPRAGQTLFVRVIPKQELPVNVKAQDGLETRTGRPNRFTATAQGAENPTIRWFFGDGAEATGPTAEHAFEGAGFWPVSVLVVAGDRIGGHTIGVRVKRSRSEPQAKDPAGAAATPTPTPSATPTTAPSGAPAAGAAAPVAPAPAAPAVPAAPLPTNVAPPPTAPPDATPAPLVPPPGGRTQSIRGLLASANPEPTALAGALTAAEALAAQPDRPTPSPAKDRRPTTAAAAGSAVSGMLLVGLLSAGALTERRRARRATDLLR